MGPKVMKKCDHCGAEFQYGPHVYDGKYIQRYDITVCMICYNGNSDGWADSRWLYDWAVVGDWVYVCFNAREVALTRSLGFESADQRRRLGPDLTRGMPEAGVLRARAMALSPPDTPLVDLLLDQRVACGIGNVYKSEVLFIHRRPPLQPLGEQSLRDFADLYGTATRLLGRNLGGGPRITREIPDGRGPLWVYGRAGLPCLVCGTPVRRERLGRNPRSTYWCLTCQVARPGS